MLNNARNRAPQVKNPPVVFIPTRRYNLTRQAYLGDEMRAKIYTDGSFSSELKRYSFGCVIITESGEIIDKCGSNNKPEALSSWNVAGEILGVMFGATWALKNNFSYVEIYHDYVGLAKWFSGEWKAKTFCSKEYVKFMNEIKSKIQIKFIKVKAHSGEKYNERADALAKKALFENVRVF
jgi:ribonuclease HI